MRGRESRMEEREDVIVGCEAVHMRRGGQIIRYRDSRDET